MVEERSSGENPASVPPPAEAIHPPPPDGPKAIISFIAAVARNGTIGKDNALPWHLPGDFRFFKAMTVGKPVIMGRKTWESIGRPLPRRPNIVVSTSLQPSAVADGVTIVRTIDDGLHEARRRLDESGREIMVIGGAELYRALFAQAHRLYLTIVDADPEGDTHFPAFDRAEWRETWSTDDLGTEKDSHAYRIEVLDRRPDPGAA